MTPRPPKAHRLQPTARVVTVGALAAGLVLGAGRLDPVEPAASRDPVAARVAAASTTTYCPGDPFAGGSKEDPKVRVDGSVDAHAAASDVLAGVITPSEDPGSIRVRSLSAGAPSRAQEQPGSGPMSASLDELGERPILVRGTQQRAPGLVAAQSLTADGAQVKGLAAVACTAPTADAWLVGGGGEKGRQERLVLSNPGGNAVTVRLSALGAAWPDGEDTVVVPAHARSVVLLDAIVGTGAPQAVHVGTDGGLIVPTMVDHHLDGLTTAGVETISPTAAPATRQVIPGNANGSGRGVVIGVPGDREAVLEVRSVGESGSRSGKVATVPAGEVVDLPLPTGSGVRSWVVESDEPVVAAGYTLASAAGGERDMAWSVATPAFGTLAGIALPAGSPSRIRRFVEVTASDGPAEADVLIQRDGKLSTTSVDLEDDHSSALSVGAAEAVWVRPTSGSVHAAVLLIGREGAPRAEASSLPLLPARVAVRDVEVVRQR